MTLQEYVINILENKDSMRESIRIIREQILNVPVDRDDVIEGLAMSAQTYDDVRTCPTNKQGDRLSTIVQSVPREIARTYRDLAQLRALIALQEAELAAMEDAVCHLSEPNRQTILLIYYERLMWGEAADRMNCSRSTVQSYRAQGILEICRYYEKYHTKLITSVLSGIELICQ